MRSSRWFTVAAQSPLSPALLASKPHNDPTPALFTLKETQAPVGAVTRILRLDWVTQLTWKISRRRTRNRCMP